MQGSRRLDVSMAEISKRVYENARKSSHVIASRPCGFVTEIPYQKGDGMTRRMYVTHENTYYSGILLPWESLDAFKEFEFHGIEIEVKARFVRAYTKEEVTT